MFSVWVQNLVTHIKGRAKSEDVCEYGVENIFT
jgi:hypothetical protein